MDVTATPFEQSENGYRVAVPPGPPPHYDRRVRVRQTSIGEMFDGVIVEVAADHITVCCDKAVTTEGLFYGGHGVHIPLIRLPNDDLPDWTIVEVLGWAHVKEKR